MNLRAMEYVVNEEAAIASVPEKLVVKNKWVAFTGTLTKMTRSSAASRLRRIGAKYDTNVRKGTDFLVLAKNGKGTAKHQLARRYKTSIITEKQFYDVIGEK